MNRRAFTLVELLVVIGILAILIGLLLPAVQAARGASRRTHCASKLRDLAIASTVHHDLFGRLPYGTVPSGKEGRFQSWIVQLLPQLEQVALSQEIKDANKFPDPFDTLHHPHFKEPLPLVSCPSDIKNGSSAHSARYGIFAGLTSYLGIAGIDSRTKDGLLFGASAIKFRDITDGISQTLLVGERPASVGNDLGWWYAGVGNGEGALDHTLGVKDSVANPFLTCETSFYHFQNKRQPETECDAVHLWSFHNGGANFARCDTSVEFIAYSIDSKILEQLATRAAAD